MVIHGYHKENYLEQDLSSPFIGKFGHEAILNVNVENIPFFKTLKTV